LLTFIIDGFANESATKLSKIILPVHDKAQPQQSSTAENWLVTPEKNTDSACETGPAVSRDVQNTRPAGVVNEKFANFSTISQQLPFAVARVAISDQSSHL
jgi:hypothetical protein